MTSTASSGDDHEYFRAIESHFIELRGAPLLLSPSDWQLARDWHRQGIPLDVVVETLDEVFAARRARGAKGKVQGLRYCAAAVEKAWEDRQDLTATGQRRAPQDFNVEEKLDRLGQALAAAAEAPPGFAEAVLGLTGTAEDIERQLAELDSRMLDEVSTRLSKGSLEEIERSVENSMAKVPARLAEAEADRVRHRLVREAIRRELGLPVLSLFAAIGR